MTIHSLTPLTKLVLYLVTNGLEHVLSSAISCWISFMSSSVPSRSIYNGVNPQGMPEANSMWTNVFDGNELASSSFQGFVYDTEAATCELVSEDQS